MLYIFDAIYFQMEADGLMVVSDVYQLASYARVTIEIRDLLLDYSPANVRVDEERYAKDGDTYTMATSDPRQRAYEKMITLQGGLARSLGIDPEARSRLLTEIKKREAIDIGVEFAQQRLVSERKLTRAKLTALEMNEKKMLMELKMIEKRSDRAHELATKRLALAEDGLANKTINDKANMALKVELAELKRKTLELQREIGEWRMAGGEDKGVPPKNIESPIERIRESNAGRKRQLQLKAAPKKRTQPKKKKGRK
jgi:hypothetical protein